MTRSQILRSDCDPGVESRMVLKQALTLVPESPCLVHPKTADLLLELHSFSTSLPPCQALWGALRKSRETSQKHHHHQLPGWGIKRSKDSLWRAWVRRSHSEDYNTDDFCEGSLWGRKVCACIERTLASPRQKHQHLLMRLGIVASTNSTKFAPLVSQSVVSLRCRESGWSLPLPCPCCIPPCSPKCSGKMDSCF